MFIKHSHKKSDFNFWHHLPVVLLTWDYKAVHQNNIQKHCGTLKISNSFSVFQSTENYGFYLSLVFLLYC